MSNTYPTGDFWMDHALQSAQSDGVRITLNSGIRQLFKYGRAENVGNSNYVDIRETSTNKTYPTTNLVTHIVSSDNSDTESFVVEGCSINNGVMTRVTQTVTLTGQTGAALATPLARVDRVYDDDTVDNAGDVYVYDGTDTVVAGVPQTAAKIYAKCPAEYDSSFEASWSTASDEYLFITQIHGFVDIKATSHVDFQLKMRLVAATPKVFRTQFSWSADSASGTIIHCRPIKVMRPNSDLKIVGKASAASADVEASFFGVVGKVY